MKKWILLILVIVIVAICVLVWFLSNSQKTVGKAIQEKDFKEFYYTYSTTVNPPEFQRYRFYTENGKKMFYHEKREGNHTILTEEDITVSGEIELTTEEWDTFWSFISGGTVKNREENTTTGGSGPYLYLYWNGDKNKCQQFSFADSEKETGFEELCANLIENN